MPARADVDAGRRLPLPDRLPGFAAGGRARPLDGTFRESSPGVLTGQESTGFVSILEVSLSGPGTSIHRGGARDRKAHLAAHETEEAHRRGRHVSPPACRLHKRLLPIRLAVRRRRLLLIVLIVEEGRLGVLATCRGGIDAGYGGIDGVQHARRITIQRGHAQAALAGRADELPAQPIDEPLPGFDVHHGRLDTGGGTSMSVSRAAHALRKIRSLRKPCKTFVRMRPPITMGSIPSRVSSIEDPSFPFDAILPFGPNRSKDERSTACLRSVFGQCCSSPARPGSDARRQPSTGPRGGSGKSCSWP